VRQYASVQLLLEAVRRHMPRFRIIEAVSLRRVKKPQFLHCAAAHFYKPSSSSTTSATPSKSRTAPTVPHNSDAHLPPSRTPLTLQAIISLPTPHRCCIACTVKEVFGATAASSSSTNHHHRCTVEESCTATRVAACFSGNHHQRPLWFCSVCLHRHCTHRRGGSSGAAAIASVQSPAPWYVYFYDLDCFWIHLDFFFGLFVCSYIFNLEFEIIKNMVEIWFVLGDSLDPRS